MKFITRKVGDTFIITASVNFDLTGWTIRSQLRGLDGSLLTDLVYEPNTFGEEESTYKLIRENTTAWKPGVYHCDIEYTDPNGIIKSTETFQVNLARGITI